MRKFYLAGGFLLTATILLLNTTRVKSNVDYPRPGNCGDAFSTTLNGGTPSTCAQNSCHPGSAIAVSPGDVTITIGTGTPTTPFNSSFKYDANTVYNVAFLINLFATNTPFYGFQIIGEDASGNQAGSFTVTNSAQTKLSTSPPFAGHNYMGHLGAGSNHNWGFKWTAPAASTGAITFTYCFNVASYTGSLPPDSSVGTIYKGSFTIQPNNVGINEIADKLSGLNIYPNPVGNQAGVSFDLKETEDVNVKLFTLNGVMAKELMNEKVNQGFCNRVFDMDGLASGVYLLKLQVGDAYITKKIVKE